MAKTVYLDNYAGLVFGYAAHTVVRSAGLLFGWVGGDPYATPPIPPVWLPIGTKVYPEAPDAIGFGVLLEIAGVGQITVSGSGVEGEGTEESPYVPYFTYSPQIVPAPGASIRTPWNPSGALLVARSNNSVELTYYLPATHDLYFRTQKTTDSGTITATLDGVALGTFDLLNASTVLAEVLLQASIESGVHTISITAEIASPRIFVYFNGFSALEHDIETGGEYLYLGPAGTLNDSSNNFVGDWGSVSGFAFTETSGDGVFFYPQLDSGGRVAVRVQKTLNSAIIAVYVDGVHQQDVDLFSDPGVALLEFTILDAGDGDATGQHEIELRNTGTANASSTGLFFYFHSAVVYVSHTDAEVLELCADYLKQVAGLRGDGAFLDAWDSQRINFDANSLYACMGLLAAYQTIGGQGYLDAVKNFLLWLASMQQSNPGVRFDDGAWNIGYRVNPSPPPDYLPAIAPYDAQGISEIRWVDAVQCLPAFVLWWYWKLSGDSATRDTLLPVFQKAIDGFIANNYDPETGFFFSSWQNKTGPTIFLYHDAIRRYNSAGNLVEQHDDGEEIFSYTGGWSSYAPQGAVGSGEHFTLRSEEYVQFSLALEAGDEIRWVTQTAWDAGIATVLVSTNGTTFTLTTSVDTYSPAIALQEEFTVYTVSSAGTYWFRIQHSGQINAAGNTAPGWQRLASRFSAGQTDVALGLTALWLFVRQPRYAALAARIIERFPARYWSADDARWLISLDGASPCNANRFWYPMTHGYTVFGQRQSRLFQPTRLLSEGLQALEAFQDSEGGFHPPGYLEPEQIFSAFYLVGENQLPDPTNQGNVDLANEHLKRGLYLLTLGGEQVGGIVFSKRYQYLYTNIAGFACLALSGIANPITEQLRFAESRMVMTQ